MEWVLDQKIVYLNGSEPEGELSFTVTSHAIEPGIFNRSIMSVRANVVIDGHKLSHKYKQLDALMVLIFGRFLYRVYKETDANSMLFKTIELLVMKWPTAQNIPDLKTFLNAIKSSN